MISVEKATEIILNHPLSLPSESVPIDQAIGRVLQEDLKADRDFPPFNRVTMDGIAIAYQTFAEGQRQFPVQGLQAAGEPQQPLLDALGCIEVMTGAVLPEHADTVIRYEDVQIQDKQATIQIDQIKSRQNVHQKGSDRVQDSIIVKAPKRIFAPEVGIAATIGKAQLQVSRLPKVVIISTGDELVPVNKTPLPHQIRSSNALKLASFLDQWKITAALLHLPDDQAKTIEGLRTSLEQFDVIILSGGVSKGKFDYVPDALAALNVQKLFHRIKQRPGKPFWFGHFQNRCMIFALPGNPVSAFMCLNRYFLPWLRKSFGLAPFETQYAMLAKPIHFKPDLTYFAQVHLHYTSNGQLEAIPIEGHGSGDLANLTDVDAFIELPEGKDYYEAGEIHRIHVFRR